MAKSVCPRCGRELPENTCFCLSCGTSRYPRQGVSTGVFPLRWFALTAAGLLVLTLAIALPFLWRSPQSEARAVPAETASAETSATLEEEPEATLETALETVPGETETPQGEQDPSDTTAGNKEQTNKPDPASPADPAEPAATAPVTTAHVHSYKRVVTLESTCTKEGLATLTCAGCGDVITEPIPCHSTVDGKCEVCGLYCYQGKSAKLVNNLTSSTANLFLCPAGSGYQDFRILSCRFYTKNGVLRASGRASVEAPAVYDDTCQIWVFFAGQNQFTTPLAKRTVTVIAKGKTGTVDFDVPLADWSALSATGYSAFEIFFADNV